MEKLKAIFSCRKRRFSFQDRREAQLPKTEASEVLAGLNGDRGMESASQGMESGLKFFLRPGHTLSYLTDTLFSAWAFDHPKAKN